MLDLILTLLMYLKGFICWQTIFMMKWLIEIVENIPIEIAPNPYNLRYMQTKKEKMYGNNETLSILWLYKYSHISKIFWR